MSSPLSPEQTEAYWRDGFVLARTLFSSTDLAPWLERTRDLAAGRVPPSPNMQLVRDVMVAKGKVSPRTPEHAICKINFFENDPVLRGYATHPRLLDGVAALLGDELLFVNSMVIAKPPGVDGRHPLHQDLLYFGFRPGDAVVGTWTALEPVTRENGCLAVLPGSHRGELHPHEIPDWEHVNFGFLGVKGMDGRGRVHVEMEPGDVLFFHSLLIHGSGQNRTQRFRRAISAHYASAVAEDLWGGVDRLASRPWIPVRSRGVAP